MATTCSMEVLLIFYIKWWVLTIELLCFVKFSQICANIETIHFVNNDDKLLKSCLRSITIILNKSHR